MCLLGALKEKMKAILCVNIIPIIIISIGQESQEIYLLPFPPLIKTLIIRCRAHPNSRTILSQDTNLIGSAKTTFPNKATFISSLGLGKGLSLGGSQFNLLQEVRC